MCSVCRLDDASGTLRLHRTFDSFGNILEETHYDAEGLTVTEGQTGYLDVAFAYTGRLLDRATGLQNNLNRWYDASLGRWLSEDPIGFAADDANLYRYVGNGPVNGTDPSRLYWSWNPCNWFNPAPAPTPITVAPPGPIAAPPGIPFEGTPQVAAGAALRWNQLLNNNGKNVKLACDAALAMLNAGGVSPVVQKELEAIIARCVAMGKLT